MVTAASASAQGGGGMRPVFGGTPERPPELRAKEISRLSPARVALDRAREINLTPDQFRKLDSLARAYDLRAKDFSRGLDTLDGIIDRSTRDLSRDRQKAAYNANRRPPENKREKDERARSDSADQAEVDLHLKRRTDARNAMGETLLATQQAFDAALTAVNGILNEEQRTKLAPIFTGLTNEFTQRLHWQNSR